MNKPAEEDALKNHSRMLGQIANMVSDFCEKEDDSTLLAVARLRARYLDLEARLAWEFVTELENQPAEPEDQ
jgi:hypothetical protein